MGLGEVLLRLNVKPTPPRDQGGAQAQPDPVVGDFVSRYLKCLGVDDLGKVPGVIKGLSSNDDTIRCLDELMRSTDWGELFTKINMEAALFEAVARHELQGLVGHGGNVSNASLSLLALHDFITSLNIIRQLMNNDNTRPIGLTTLAKITYLLFDLYMELSKRKLIPPNLEVEMWKVRETLVEIMEELFKGNRMIAMDGKSFDGNGKRRR
jgi:hypothetical protein